VSKRVDRSSADLFFAAATGDHYPDVTLILRKSGEEEGELPTEFFAFRLIEASVVRVYTIAGEEGSVFGLDSSIQAASRAVAPLAGAGIAYWFSLRATFGVTAMLFLAMSVIVLWLLPADSKTEKATPIPATGD